MGRKTRKMRGPTADEIERFITDRGLTNIQVAELVGINERKVAEFRSGRSHCPWVTWWALYMRVDGTDIDEPMTDVIREAINGSD